MSVKSKVISILKDNENKYISGGNMAGEINVSRTAVCKAVKALTLEGYDISAVTNKGYCLNSGSDVLSAETIYANISTEKPTIDVRVYNSVDSTNSLLRKEADNGGKEGLFIVSAEQTKGRGRYGRQFFSPTDTGLYMSLLLKPKLKSNEAVMITTMAAAAVCKALEQISSISPKIKWVNDIFVNNKKVCGILTEASFNMESGQIDYIILGVGINIYSPNGGFPDDIKSIAGGIFTKKESDLRNRIAAAFINNFFAYYNTNNLNNYVDEYKKRSLIIGETIYVVKKEEKILARALDINEKCHLLVEYSNGKQEWLSSGEVSIKRKE